MLSSSDLLPTSGRARRAPSLRLLESAAYAFNDARRDGCESVQCATCELATVAWDNGYALKVLCPGCAGLVAQAFSLTLPDGWQGEQ